MSCHELSEEAFCLRLVFQGIEAMLTYDTGPGIIRSESRQLFRICTTLWKPTETLNSLNPKKTYKFKFIIQMPLVQFPPSMDHEYYRCMYKLSAHLDVPVGLCYQPVTTLTTIKYIPLTETKFLKAPIFLEDLKKKKKSSVTSTLSTSVKLHSIEYVSGGTIQATVYVKGLLNDNEIQSRNELSIVLTLYQVSKFNSDAEPILENIVETQTHVIRDLKDYNNGEKQYQLTVPIDELLPPTFKYGMVMCLSYKLKIKIYLKKARPPLDSQTSTKSTSLVAKYHSTSSKESSAINSKRKNKFRKYLGFSWSTAIAAFETPIVISTLGRGIRAGDELRDYSKYQNNSNIPMPRPCFIQSIEYQDVLPIYDDIRLPSYSDTHHGDMCSKTIQPTPKPKSIPLIIYSQNIV